MSEWLTVNLQTSPEVPVLGVPSIDPQGWRLDVKGLEDLPFLPSHPAVNTNYCTLWGKEFYGILITHILQFESPLTLGGGFKYFVFSPLHVEIIQFDEHIFQMGWFNHQLLLMESIRLTTWDV